MSLSPGFAYIGVMDVVFEQVMRAAEVLKASAGIEGFDAVLVLGSGLGSYADRHPRAVAVSYADIPGFPIPRADGHVGSASAVEVNGNRVLLLAGRAHAYEGHDLSTVVLPVRAAIAAGARTVILTNAAGGIPEQLQPGDLAMLSDHINLTGLNPLVGTNDDRIGPRFPDMTDVYTPRLRELARRTAASQGMTMHEAVYAWWFGPSFETPAEIRMIRTLGGDLAGMSTVPEAIAARHMGADVVAFSLVTNRAAGLSDGRLSSEEVLETAASVRPRIEAFMDTFLASRELTAGARS